MDNVFSDDLKEFKEHHSIKRMYQSLVFVFIDFVRFQKDGMPTNSYNLLNDIEALFELMEIIDRHDDNDKR